MSVVFFSAFALAQAQTGDDTPEVNFENLMLEAKAAYVLDLKTGSELWSKNGEAQLPLASLTKLMTAYAAHEEGVDDLAESCFTLVSSSNERADAIGGRLASTVASASEIMNMWANDIDMRQTFYLNTTGLDIDETRLAGAYGSAHDQALLLARVEDTAPELLRCTTHGFASLADETLPNTNKELARMTGIIGSKTGFTDLAGGNLGVVVDLPIDHKVAIVVLGSSEEGRFSDIKQLISATTQYLANQESD